MVVESRGKPDLFSNGVRDSSEAEIRVANLRLRLVDAARWKLTTMDLRCFAGGSSSALAARPGAMDMGRELIRDSGGQGANRQGGGACLPAMGAELRGQGRHNDHLKEQLSLIICTFIISFTTLVFAKALGKIILSSDGVLIQ